MATNTTSSRKKPDCARKIKQIKAKVKAKAKATRTKARSITTLCVHSEWKNERKKICLAQKRTGTRSDSFTVYNYLHIKILDNFYLNGTKQCNNRSAEKRLIKLVDELTASSMLIKFVNGVRIVV